MENYKITEYCRKFPGLEIEDVLKFLHQSCFGCEHLVSDENRVLMMIREELSSAAKDCIGGIEYLDGPFVRLHLDAVESGLAPETLAKLFVLSSQKEVEGLSAMSAKLGELCALAGSGKVHFSAAAVSSAIEQWRKTDFAPLHHSASFRQRYCPAYRVIAEEYVPYLPLLRLIDIKSQRGPLIVAIDGRCASGKTTLGNLLAKLYDCNVFHMDDFFLQPQQRTADRLMQPGENVDHERFLEEVLFPVSKGCPVLYRRYNCHSGKMDDPVYVTPKELTIVEGVYSLHESLSDYYGLKIFLDISAGVQKSRLILRNGAEFAERFFDKWIPMEERYFSAFSVREKADIMIL